MGFPGRCMWKAFIFGRHHYGCFRTGLSGPLQYCQLGTDQCFCTWHWVCSQGIFWSGRCNDSLEEKQCAKSRWKQILRELMLVTGVICYQLCSNWSLPFSWGKSWSTLKLEEERMSPWESVTQTHIEQHLCFFRALFTASLQKGCRMATSLFPTLQKFIKGQSRKEVVDFYWTWGNVW